MLNRLCLMPGTMLILSAGDRIGIRSLMMSSAGAMLPVAMENILFDFLPVGMKGLLLISYFPQFDVIGIAQCDVHPASAIPVAIVPSKTACRIASSSGSLLLWSSCSSVMLSMMLTLSFFRCRFDVNSNSCRLSFDSVVSIVAAAISFLFVDDCATLIARCSSMVAHICSMSFASSFSSTFLCSSFARRRRYLDNAFGVLSTSQLVHELCIFSGGI